ncbi:MAG: hypothetical protein VBE63_18075 [Lamprobacter sp.]|uniref:DUF7680 family protein n=1 Tax=Lamprobacter sp. TaxID=3100796 RepID=UPI002B25CEC8|nr:hypothetical protein [Lamprobacter sp.]MEA3641824.1 hypothetical protein [Lamprobacter sp.]
MPTSARASSRTPRASTAQDDAQLAKQAKRAPYLLRITRRSDLPPPLLIIKERIAPEDRDDIEGLTNPRAKHLERGSLHGEGVRACLPVLKRILETVKDDQGIPLGLERYLSAQGLQDIDRNLPLDEAAGARLALFFRLQSKVKDVDRIELIGRRIAMLSREEAVYWLANVTTADPALRSWAISGLRLMLCGDSGDKRLPRVLERMRARG